MVFLPYPFQQLDSHPLRWVSAPYLDKQVGTMSDNVNAPVTGWAFERIEEYKAVLENVGQVSARRQGFNNVFVGINTVFLTGVGFLLLSTHLNSWWLVGALAAISLTVTPINFTWRQALLRYKNGLTEQYAYIRDIEKEFRRRHQEAYGDSNVGVYLRLDEQRRRPHSGNTRLEIRIATYFTALYPAITICVALVTYMTTNQLLPPFSL